MAEKRLTKSEREAVRLLFGGCCAYCGHALPARWHADHVEAIHRNDWLGAGLPASRPENHRLDNFFPSCPPCNISKGPMTIEAWRGWLAGHIRSLNAHHPIYRLAKAYGLVIETGAPVVFHFERVSLPAEPSDGIAAARPLGIGQREEGGCRDA